MGKIAYGCTGALIGAIAGAVAMHYATKAKTAAIIAEKEKSITEYYMKLMEKELYMQDEQSQPPAKNETTLDTSKVRKVEPTHSTISFSTPIIADKKTQTSYSKLAREYDAYKNPNEDAALYPYPIAPDEFGDSMQYDQISLKYYSDDVLTDDNDKVLSPDEIAEWVGTGFAAHIGMYEEDAAHIRNEKMMCEFEILLQNKPFSLVKGSVTSVPRGPLDE